MVWVSVRSAIKMFYEIKRKFMIKNFSREIEVKFEVVNKFLLKVIKKEKSNFKRIQKRKKEISQILRKFKIKKDQFQI